MLQTRALARDGISNRSCAIECSVLKLQGFYLEPGANLISTAPALNVTVTIINLELCAGIVIVCFNARREIFRRYLPGNTPGTLHVPLRASSSVMIGVETYLIPDAFNVIESPSSLPNFMRESSVAWLTLPPTGRLDLTGRSASGSARTPRLDFIGCCL